MPDYSKVGENQAPKAPKSTMPRPSPADLAKKQRELNQERLRTAEKQRLRREAGELERVVAKEQTKGKRTKDEREREFIIAIEMILGHPLFEWQKEWIKEIRKASFEGRSVNVTLEEVHRRRGY